MKTKKHLLTTALAILINLAATRVPAQTFDWAKAFGGSSGDTGRSIAVDSSGNVYTTGEFQGIVDFDPGAGIANLASAGGQDVFVQKLDADGNFLWAKAFGGSGFSDIGFSITVDAAGNVYTTGYFEGTADFDPSVGTAPLTSEGDLDVFVQKLDADGNFLWAKAFGGNEYDKGSSITVDPAGNVYTTGRFEETVDFDPGAGTDTLTSAGVGDVFVQKLDADGNFLWAKTFGGNEPFLANNGFSITADIAGNVYTTGKFFGIVDFDPGAGTATLASGGSDDVFVQKLDATGNFLWAKAFGGSIGDSDGGQSITVDAAGNVYTTGYFEGTADFDPGAGSATLTSAGDSDIFVQKLDADGNFLWAKAFGNSSFDAGISISTDAAGNVYTTGYFEGTADFDPGAGSANLTSAGERDVFVQKLDATGNFLWAKAFGSSSFDEGFSISADAAGNVYTTGYFRKTVDFDPGAGSASLTSAGASDVFIQKMSQSTTGIVDMGRGIHIKAFPNPSMGLVQLTFEQALTDVAITVTDMQGKIVFTKQLDVTSNEQIQIDGAAGVYFLKVKTDSGQGVLKLVKE